MERVSRLTAIGVAKSGKSNAALRARNLRSEIHRLRQQLSDCEQNTQKQTMMVREGDHRIKNSLQMIASLMRLQARREADPTVRVALSSAAARVTSVGSIHDALHTTFALDSIDLSATLKKMCASLQAITCDQGNIRIVVDIEPLEVPISLAQPITISVAELVTNAIRHAFSEGHDGTVRVSGIRTRDGIEIAVSDDGHGFSALSEANMGFGMRLVSMLVAKTGGQLQLKNESGAHFTMHIPLSVNDRHVRASASGTPLAAAF